uniref:Uncharacterized protein n=1 Tax=Arundo donax TaxID=35708 RepID=A0A0A9G952_ARUDO
MPLTILSRWKSHNISYIKQLQKVQQCCSTGAAATLLHCRNIILYIDLLTLARPRSCILTCLDCSLTHNSVDLSQDLRKCILDIGGLKRGGLHEIK